MTPFTKESNESHFVLVPLAAQGHLIPMIDIGCLLAERGVRVSLIITPANANRIKPKIKQVKESNLSIEFVEFNFPSEKFGLPPGCESFDHVNIADYRALYDAIYSLDEPLEAFLGSLERPPDCMISDVINAWTAPVARKFGIKRVNFHVACCMYVHADYSLEHHKVYDRITDVNEYVTVPEFPVKLEVTKAQTPGFLNTSRFADMRSKVLAEELTADGVVINTFHEIEQPFIENYEKVTGKRVWPFGPICLYNKDVEMNVGRGNMEAIEQGQRVLNWLDGRDPRSVLFINFGSLAYTNPSQLMEIGSALEQSNVPFIWVVKKIELKPDTEKWLSKFEERTKDRGLIIVGWAPQTVILSHPAVGGFMTHCGWNSITEALSMGVPMITWPRFLDQFVNENLVVDVLKIGVPLGVKVPNYDSQDVMVKSDDISKAIFALTDGGIEAHERRERTRHFSEKAKKAMDEGGSSYRNVTDFINYFTEPEVLKQDCK